MFQYKCSHMQQRFGASNKKITKQNVKKFVTKYAKRHGMLPRPACPFMDAIDKLEEVVQIKEMRKQYMNYTIPECKDIMSSAILRGIQISCKVDIDGKDVFSIFSMDEGLTVMLEEGRAFKMLLKKDKRYIKSLCVILAKKVEQSKHAVVHKPTVIKNKLIRL